jgi:hypothetical protein
MHSVRKENGCEVVEKQYRSPESHIAHQICICGAGAIPFIALSPPVASAIPFMPAALVANASLLQIGYGASIASFLGGIHWAMAMAEYGGAHFPARRSRVLEMFTVQRLH